MMRHTTLPRIDPVGRNGRPDPMTQILENGDFFFCYRPKVDVRRVGGSADVQRFFVILKPWAKPLFRRMIVGRKRLPGVAEHERTWGLVDMVTSKPVEIEDELDPVSYSTRARGRRQEPPARPAGEGVYAVATHNGHTHLVYALELPEEPGPVQVALNIKTQASLVAAVRNPDAPVPRRPGTPQPRDPGYPDELRAKFAGRRFTDLDPPDFLDFPGTEVVLIGAGTDVGRELGLSLRPRRKTRQSAGIFTVLGMERDVHPLKPHFTGEWE
jgi:hypothetical protein